MTGDLTICTNGRAFQTIRPSHAAEAPHAGTAEFARP
jgi:hypothetical protein